MFGMTTPENQEAEPSPGEYIWFEDFENRNVAAFIANARINGEPVRTYGQLALLSDKELLALGLISDELPFVQKVLKIGTRALLPTCEITPEDKQFLSDSAQAQFLPKLTPLDMMILNESPKT